MELVFASTFSPVIDRVFPLDEVQAAEKYLQNAGHFGKVLLQVS